MENEERVDWLVLVICILSTAIVVVVLWTKNARVGDCYYSLDGEVKIGVWKLVDEKMACAAIPEITTGLTP